MSTESTSSSSTASKSLMVKGGIALVTIAILGYLAVCTFVYQSDTILSNVTVYDISVGGLTKTEAEAKINEEIAKKIESTPITLTQGSWNALLQGDIAQADISSAVTQALSVGRENFFTAAAVYFTGQGEETAQVTIPLTFNESGKALFHSLLDEADATMNGAVIESSWVLDGESGTLWVEKGSSGMAVDRNDAESATLVALSAGRATSIPLSTDTTTPKSLDFQAVKEEIFVEAKSATIDPETLDITDHVVGLDLDVTQAKQMYDQASEGDIFPIPLVVTQPEETSNDVRAYLFADVLAETTSLVSGTTNRKFNIQMAAERANETIIMPGEIFSYYETSGPFTAAEGYKDGAAYVNGQTVLEAGGGICQVSSTIYYATLHTTLEIVERRNHSFSVSYVPLGMDATMYSTMTDFKFKNNTPYPIKLMTETRFVGSSQYLDVTIYGTKTDDITIVPKSTVFNYTTSPAEYIVDTSLAPGTQVQVQSAYTGSQASVTLYYYDGNGDLIDTVLHHTDTYKSRAAIYRHNPIEGSEGEAVPEGEASDTGMDIVPSEPSQEYVEPEYVEPEYVEPAPEYVEPAPEYVEPAPEYVEPTPEPTPETYTPSEETVPGVG